MRMKTVTSLVILCVLFALAASQGANRKKFGSNQKSNPDYDPPPEDYDQDALYYEDYDEQGAKKDKTKDDKEGGAVGSTTKVPTKEKTDKPALSKPAGRPHLSLARPALKETAKDDHKAQGGAPSLFIPRRNRTPFTPRPADKPKPTLPSFIRNPANPGAITTPRPPPARASLADRISTTAKTPSAVIRATTARPSRFKNGGSSSSGRDRTTASPTDDNGNRKYGGAGSRTSSKVQRGGYRSGSTYGSGSSSSSTTA